MSSADTKSRIMDVAEVLFADKGFPATSLRDITREAGTNLASVILQTKALRLGAIEEFHGGQIDARREDPIWEMHNMIFNNNLFKTKYFNFVFPVFQDNAAWWEVFANPRCRQIVTDMADAAVNLSNMRVKIVN